MYLAHTHRLWKIRQSDLVSLSLFIWKEDFLYVFYLLDISVSNNGIYSRSLFSLWVKINEKIFFAVYSEWLPTYGEGMTSGLRLESLIMN